MRSTFSRVPWVCCKATAPVAPLRSSPASTTTWRKRSSRVRSCCSPWTSWVTSAVTRALRLPVGRTVRKSASSRSKSVPLSRRRLSPTLRLVQRRSSVQLSERLDLRSLSPTPLLALLHPTALRHLVVSFRHRVPPPLQVARPRVAGLREDLLLVPRMALPRVQRRVQPLGEAKTATWIHRSLRLMTRPKVGKRRGKGLLSLAVAPRCLVVASLPVVVPCR